MITDSASTFPKYDLLQTYEWNFQHAPTEIPQVDVAPVPGKWTYCGMPVNSPLGIAAGPLLNGKWCRYYAALGFDVVTYKTVRTGDRECYPLPNLVPVESTTMSGDEESVPASENWQGSWAVSFGMPSKIPQFWMKDVRETKAQLKAGQLLSVSVVGTMQPGWTIEDLAHDYAQCAKWAFDAGADCVEMNFSCPNVCSEDGQLFQNPDDAAFVAETARGVVGADVPLLVKIGHLSNQPLLEELVSRLSHLIDAIVTTNSIPARVNDAVGGILFDGQQRGICGRATQETSVEQVRRIDQVIEKEGFSLDVIGVGGIETAADVQRYLEAGANSVQLATAVMVDPLVGVKIRTELAEYFAVQ